MKYRNLFIALSFMAAVLPSCGGVKNVWEDCAYVRDFQPAGQLVTDNRQVSDFKSVTVNGLTNVDIHIGEAYSLNISGDANLVPFVETVVENNTLKISLPCMPSGQTVSAVLVMPQVNGVHNLGSGIVSCTDSLSLSDLELKMTGSGTIDFPSIIHVSRLSASLSGSGNINAGCISDDVATHITGSGNIVLSGTTGSLISEIVGSGTLKSFTLESAKASVKITGSGDAEISAKEVDARITGSGDILCTGNPDIRQHITGSGKVLLQK